MQKYLNPTVLFENFNFNLMVKRISLEQSGLRALNLFYNSRIEFISANVKYVHKKRFYLQTVLLAGSTILMLSFSALQVLMEL